MSDIRLIEKVKSNRYLLGVIMIQTFFLAFLIHREVIAYETNDDFFFSAIAGGMFGVYSPYVVFNNILYGRILAFLYQCCGQVNWVAVLYVVCIYISYILLSVVFFKKMGDVIGSVITLSFYFLTFSQFYTKLNFTRIAGIACIAGFLFWCFCLEKNSRTYHVLSLAGCFMVVWGSMIRFQVFLMVSAFAVAPFIMAVFLIENKKIKLGEWKRYVVTGGVLALIIFGLRCYHQYVYTSDANWAYYMDYNEVRSELLDYGMPNYEINKETYEAIGFSPTDYEMFCNVAFADPEVFSLEKLQAIAGMKEKTGFGFSTIIAFIREGLWQYRGSELLVFAMLCVLIYMLTAKNCRYFLPIWGLGCTVAELWYLFAMRRELERVMFIPILCLICLILYNYDISTNEKIHVNMKKSLLMVAVYSIVAGGVLNLPKQINRGENYEETIDFLDNISQTEGSFYLWDMYAAGNLFSAYGTFGSPTPGAMANSSFLGGWSIFTPIDTHNLAVVGIDNPLRALAENENVYLIGSAQKELVLRYLQEHYGENIYFSLEQETGGFCVWKFAGSDADIL